LRAAREARLVTKSNLILGLGEERPEITEAMKDLRAAGCDLLTITQYLRPTPRHHPVERWVKPEEFVELREEALEIGFAGVMSGPLVRSSYRAGRLYRQAAERRAATAVLARGDDPLEPPAALRAPRKYFADTPATRRAQGPVRWAGGERLDAGCAC
jgi:lipoic acid synthetase